MGRLNGHRLAVAAFVAYAVALAFVLLNPRVAVPNSGIGWAADAARAIRMPEWFLEARRFEFLSNALIFVPLPVLGAIAWPALPSWCWAAVGSGSSVVIEIVQGVALEQRSASVVDVLANTLGAVVGAAVVAAVRRRRSAT